MVAREDLLEDLLHVLHSTQWPPDPTDSSRRKTPPPKPVRAPHLAPLEHASPTENAKGTSRQDLSSFMSSFLPDERSLDVRAQYDQVDPDPAPVLSYGGTPFGGPATPPTGGQQFRYGAPSVSSLKPSGADDPSSKSGVPPLGTPTQRRLLDLLARLCSVEPAELRRLEEASCLRQRACVTLLVSLEMLGELPPTLKGDLRLLRTCHARILASPLPPLYSTSMSVDNLWSQQLLVRFSRERAVVVDETRTLKRLRAKKTPKPKVTLPLPVEVPQPSPAPSVEVSSLHPPLQDSPSVEKSSSGFEGKTSATLQRGLKGIRKSFKKKKNKHKGKDGGEEGGGVGGQSVPTTPIVVTPSDTPTQGHFFEEKTSASPFLRFRSLRVKKSDSAAFERINKLRASFGKGRLQQQRVADQESTPVVVKKDELVTKSEPPRKTFKVNNTFEMVDLIEDESLDSTNPFATRNSARSENLEESNPFSPSYLGPSTPGQMLTDQKKRSKSFRKSIRKTFSKMSGLKKKKNNKEESEDDREQLGSSAAPHKTVSRQLFKEGVPDSPKEEQPKKNPLPAEVEGRGKKEESSHDSSTINEDNYEELKCRIINLRDVGPRAEYSEHIELLPTLRVKLSLELDIDFKTKCRVFELYKNTFSMLYKERFIELLPQKGDLEGVDCNASVEGETLLKQVVTFCGLQPEKVALARFLVLVEAATGKMGTPNSLFARRACQQKSSSCLSSAAGTASTSTSELDASARPDENTLQEAQEFVYNQKSETLLVNPGDITRLLQQVKSGLSQDLFTVSEKNSAVESSVALCRWVIGHHIERLQTVFPVSGAPTTSDNLAETLKCLKAVEEDPTLAEGYASDVAELGLDGLRSNLAQAIRKYTELWVAALIRETTHRIDTAMTDAAPAVSVPQSTSSAALSVPPQHGRSHTSLTLDVPTMVEAVPTMLTNFVRNVRQFENNKQIAYLAEVVEKRLGTYRPLPNALGNSVPMPMLTYQRDEQAPPDEDEVAEMVLRLNVVGLLMPVIVDYLDVAKHFYNPIFKENFGLAFLDECWAALVGGTLSLYRQIGAKDVLRVSLVDPPLKPEMLPQAIGAVWALCESFSSINKLGEASRVQKCGELISCMEDCVMCWLLLIAQRTSLQLEKDLKRLSAENLEQGLQELENDMIDFIKLVVDKTERLVWAEGQCPKEMLRFLGSQLAYQLHTFWRSLYNDYTNTQASPNVISKWACEVMSCLCELRDELSKALLRLDPDKSAMQEAHNSLQLMPQKAAQKMCYEEVRSLEEWVGQAAGGGGGGALVHKLDEVLSHVYDQLGPCQPLVSILRDRVLDATQGHLDTITQEEEFIQLAAVLQALQQFFTSSILLEESLQQAEDRWEEQLSLARERGLPLAELQQRYYAQRLQEQQLQLVEDQTSASMLLVNVVFIEGMGLSVSMVQAPSAPCLVRAALKSPSSLHHNNNNIDSNSHQLNGDLAARSARTLRPSPSSKTSGIISNMFKGVSSTGGVYVKAQLVPAEWFPTAPTDRKTSVCKDDPAVFDEELTFPTVHHHHAGVERGGFLLLRLKLTRRMRSHVVSEALVALSDLPVLTPENRRSKPHTHLILTRAEPLHSYEPLNILRRRNDDVTRQFLQQLEHDNKGHTKADLGGSNVSISSMW